MDATARGRAEKYLVGLDAAAPGLVAGLHVVGSAALDDYRPGSDLDLVVELAGAPYPPRAGSPHLA
ncbi:MAG TPA: nucleotidyltransferase domain-containing protein, partial [Pseudonocardiaceae bacterium]